MPVGDVINNVLLSKQKPIRRIIHLMNETVLKAKLDEFLALPAETEWFEFKEAKTAFEIDSIGKYFSALSNEANLRSLDSAWLIFGVSDKKENCWHHLQKCKKSS